jgi:hypothetical protein
MRLIEVSQLVESIIEKYEIEMVEIVKNLTKRVRHAVQNGVRGDIRECGTKTGRTFLLCATAAITTLKNIKGTTPAMAK